SSPLSLRCRPWIAKPLYTVDDSGSASQNGAPQNGRPPPGLVRPASSPAALAGTSGKAPEALPRLALRDHAAADHGAHRRALFREVPDALAAGREFGRGSLG